MGLTLGLGIFNLLLFLDMGLCFYMETSLSLPLLAILFTACASVPPTPCQKAARTAPYRGTYAKCAAYAVWVTPLLRHAGAKNVHFVVMEVGGQVALHVAVEYDEQGRRWIVDNMSGPRHAVGDTVQEQIERFANPFYDDMHGVKLVADLPR